MSKHLNLSVCTYNDGTFDVFMEEPGTGRGASLTGKQELTDEEFDFINEFAPACVFTKYQRVTPED